MSVRNNYSTPAQVARLMCSRVGAPITDSSKTIFDPGGGDGSLLLNALHFRLNTIKSFDISAVFQAVSTLYGIDKSPCAVETCRSNLRNAIADYVSSRAVDYRFLAIIDNFLEHNIIVGDALNIELSSAFPTWKCHSMYDWSPCYGK